MSAYIVFFKYLLLTVRGEDLRFVPLKRLSDVLQVCVDLRLVVRAFFEEHNVCAHDGAPFEQRIAQHWQQQVLEGPASEGVVVLEFPTTEAARTWYDSPAYQAVAEHRFKGATFRVVLVEGA